MLNHFLDLGRHVIVLGVVGALVAAIACQVYGVVKIVCVIIGRFRSGWTSTKGLAVSFLEAIDLFLIGTVFYIVAIGLYELFISSDAHIPQWLAVHSLDDLKLKVINGIVLIVAIYYVGALVDWDGKSDLLRLSISITLVIAVLTFFGWAAHGGAYAGGSSAGTDAQGNTTHAAQH